MRQPAAMLRKNSAPSSTSNRLEPDLVQVLREGYSLADLRQDAVAALTVAILALPLSMAIAIGCGVSPEKGLITSVVAGALISALGGSRFQVGGPAAAFIVIIGAVIAAHGYDGMLIATLIAGAILILAGLMRLGSFIRYIPGPVVLGFTSGIGLLIGLSQLKDFLGLKGDIPLEFFHKIVALWQAMGTFNPAAFAVGATTLAGIFVLRAWRPRWPGLLFAVVVASLAVWALGLQVETIGTRFGGIPSALPLPKLPEMSWAKVLAVLPSAFTMAFLIGVESLMSAVAADTMAGTRHRSNMEILAQGAANVASALFGGLPATGVIARTGANITAGAKTPVAGVLHALFVLALMVLAAPLVAYLALPSLAAVLLGVAWRLLDLHELRFFLTRAPWDDRLILLVTLFLTVLVDLNVAIAVGVVLASMLFMHRMAELPGVDPGGPSIFDDVDVPGRQAIPPIVLPRGVQVFQFRGPLFFGAAAAIDEALLSVDQWPRAIILRLREVPLIDMTALSVLEDLAARCAKHDCRIVVSGLQPQPRVALHRAGFLRSNRVILARDLSEALAKAGAVVNRSKKNAVIDPVGLVER
jgi:sulfate permease, SulP family